jgi:RHS repeat-associated protein
LILGVIIAPVVNNPFKYKYQGQERQDELGLNWDSFKWRNYDYAIGRFMSIDPLSEKYSYQSHYNFQRIELLMVESWKD